MKTLQTVSVSGSRYECGHQHGEQVKEHIKHNSEFYFGWWQRNLDMTRKDVYEYAEDALDVTKRFEAGFIDEMQGIADGSDSDLEEIAAMNGRYELAWASKQQLKGGCTCIAALPRRSESGATLLAQNWDYRMGVTESCIVLKAKVDEGPSVLMHTEAGIIGQKGLNSNGIGLVINAMVSDRDSLGESVPFFLVCRKMLESIRFSDAVKVLLNAKRSLSYNVMLAAGEVAVNLEAHPDDVSLIYPRDGCLAHTNHFIGDRALTVKDNFVLNESNSIHRYIIASEKLASTDKHSYESFKTILTDHFDHPLSICHHPNMANDSDHWEETVSSVFMDPAKRLFMCTAGPPCSNPYQTYSL